MLIRAAKKRWGLRAQREPSQPLRAGWDKLGTTVRRGMAVPAYPSVAQEVADILKHNDYSIYEHPDCEDYRVLLSTDPKGQYPALCIHQKKTPGISVEAGNFWVPIKANAHTGPAIKGFPSMLHATAHAQVWLEGRIKGKISAEAQKQAFMRAKGIKPKKETKQDE